MTTITSRYKVRCTRSGELSHGRGMKAIKGQLAPPAKRNLPWIAATGDAVFSCSLKADAVDGWTAWATRKYHGTDVLPANTTSAPATYHTPPGPAALAILRNIEANPPHDGQATERINSLPLAVESVIAWAIRQKRDLTVPPWSDLVRELKKVKP